MECVMRFCSMARYKGIGFGGWGLDHGVSLFDMQKKKNFKKK